MYGNDALHLAQLRAFASVVENGSFTRAAAQLYMSQPAVSAHIRRLERSVGAQLLVRDGRRIVPTELGLTVYRYACEVRAVLGNLQHDVESALALHLNHCVVGAPRVYSTYVLTDLLAQFQQSHTATHLTLIEVPTTDLVERVRQGQLDVGVALALGPLDEEHAQLLGMEPRIIVESAERPITASGELTYAEYVQAPYVRILFSGGQAAPSADGSPPEWQFDRQNAVMSVSGWESAKRVVRAGRGLLGTFRPVVRSELESGEFRMVAVEGFEVNYHVYLLTAQRHRTPSVVMELTELLRTHLPLAMTGDS